MMVSLAAQDAEPVVTSVLGLRSEDKKAGERLTTSLRSAFAEREMSGGQELTLEEVILTLDCASEEDTACMTEAGSALETEKLVYGVLNTSGGGYVIEISVLDVTTGQVEAQGSLPFDKEALSASNVDTTATEVVNSLYPQADTSVVAATPTTDDNVPPPPEETDTATDSNYIWGSYKPRPTWKKVGLGVSVALTVGGIVVGTVGWVTGESFNDAVDKRRAELAQSDDELSGIAANPSVKPPAFCKEALLNPETGKRDPFGRFEPKDELAADACQPFMNRRGMYIGGLTTAIVAGASTALFTLLLFVHKKKRPKSDASRRTFRLAGVPTRSGAMLGGAGRF